MFWLILLILIGSAFVATNIHEIQDIKSFGGTLIACVAAPLLAMVLLLDPIKNSLRKVFNSGGSKRDPGHD